MQFSSRRHLPDRELSRERPFSSAPFHICPEPSRPGASGGDVDLNGHSQIVRGETRPRAVHRNRRPGTPHNCDTHQPSLAHTLPCPLTSTPPAPTRHALTPL